MNGAITSPIAASEHHQRHHARLQQRQPVSGRGARLLRPEGRRSSAPRRGFMVRFMLHILSYPFSG